MRNGISGDTPMFNGMSDLAMRCVCYWKRDIRQGRSYEHAPGGFYIQGKREGRTTEELATGM